MHPSFLAQAFSNFLLEHKGLIFIISLVVSLLFSMVIFSLLHRFRVLQEEEWVRPFALGFAVLAVAYSIRFLLWLVTDQMGIPLPTYYSYSVASVLVVCSAFSNYYFFRTAFPLTDKRRKIRDRVSSFLHVSPANAGRAALLLLALAALISVKGEWAWARVPDVFFSASALVFIGVALFRNTRSSRDPLMAWLALLTAVAYAILHIVYGLHPWLAGAGWADWLTGPDALVITTMKMDLIVFSAAVILKAGLFFPAHALMLVIASPAGGVRRLLKGITEEQSEFLDDDGVVTSIREEIQATRVEVFIKLPGTKRNKVGRYSSPSAPGRQKNAPEECTFKRDTPYGYVMSSGVNILYRLINHADYVPGEIRAQLPPRTSVIAMPVLFHNAVIGCLKADLADGKFTEVDMKNLKRFAALLSPAIQDYREVDALNEFSHSLTQLQIDASGYDIQAAANDIAKLTHDILAPLATGLSIEAGFHRHLALIPEEGDYGDKMREQLKAPYAEVLRASSGENLSWWPKKLKITSHELKVENNEHFFGKLLLASPARWDRANPPTLATNFFHRRVVSNLITDAILSFIRGHLTDIAKELGVRLGNPGRANVPGWFETIEETAKDAHLLWAVTAQKDYAEMLGAEAELVLGLERSEKWEKKDTYDDKELNNLDLWLCTLKSPQRGTSHVIKIHSRATEQDIWLGVGNAAFDLELDYLSPWKAFILRFGVIADTALQRIRNEQVRENLEKEAADFHGLATAAITTGTVIHQIVNQVRDLTSPLTTLENSVKLGHLRGNASHKRLIVSLNKAAGQIVQLTKLFSGVTKPDDRRPCSLQEALDYAFHLLRDSFGRYNISFSLQVPAQYVVDVPFYVAAFALANLLNNAKDAIRDGKVKSGEVCVESEETENLILCHVVDNGPGVPARLIGQLFKSGGRGDKPHGSGLGLYLSARSLREARGDIKLKHPGPDPRTTFTIYFPKQRKD